MKDAPRIRTRCCPDDTPVVVGRGNDDEVARLAWAVAHPARVRLLRILIARDACVCGELVDQMDLAQSTVSQHLKRLVEAGLVRREERGKWSYFSLDAQAFERVAALALLPKGVCC